MNWTLPGQQLGRKFQGPSCSNLCCASSAWERWRSRRSGVLLNSRWYCGEACFRVGLQSLIARSPQEVKGTSAHRLPLGLLMFSRGLIDQPDLVAALHMKEQTPQLRIGECLCRLGLVKEDEVTRALGVQAGLPVLLGFYPKADRLVPLRLQQVADAYCFRAHSDGVIYVGFAAGEDMSLVQAISNLLGVVAEPCILPSRVVNERLSTVAEMESGTEIVFETRMLGSEMIDVICSYARQICAESVRVAHTHQYAWVRLRGHKDHDLLFRVVN